MASEVHFSRVVVEFLFTKGRRKMTDDNLGGASLDNAIATIASMNADSIDREIESLESRLSLLRALRRAIKKPATPKVRKARAKKGEVT